MRTRRPDLEALEFQRPPSIADIVAPPLWKTKKVGYQYFADLRVATATQTNRSLGAAPTRTNVVPANTTFSLAEAITGYTVDNTSLPEMDGGLPAWQQSMALSGKQAVGGTIEGRVAAGIFGVVGSTITEVALGDNILLNVQTIRTTIENLGSVGMVVMFGAKSTLDRLKHMTEVLDRMTFTGVIPKDARGVRSMSWQTVAEVFDVDMVLPGPNTQWLGSGSAYDGYVGVALIPAAGMDPNAYPQFARNLCYDWIGTGNGQPSAFAVETFPHDVNAAEALDVTALTQIQLFNPELCQVITGVDADEVTA
jgi:hypothetical protein